MEKPKDTWQNQKAQKWLRITLKTSVFYQHFQVRFFSGLCSLRAQAFESKSSIFTRKISEKRHRPPICFQKELLSHSLLVFYPPLSLQLYNIWWAWLIIFQVNTINNGSNKGFALISIMFTADTDYINWRVFPGNTIAHCTQHQRCTVLP